MFTVLLRNLQKSLKSPIKSSFNFRFVSVLNNSPHSEHAIKTVLRNKFVSREICELIFADSELTSTKA